MVSLLLFGPCTGEDYSQTNRLFSSTKHSNAICAAPTQTSLCSGELQDSCLATPRATIVKRAIFGTALATSSSCLSLEIAQNLHKHGARKSECIVPCPQPLTCDLLSPPSTFPVTSPLLSAPNSAAIKATSALFTALDMDSKSAAIKIFQTV